MALAIFDLDNTLISGDSDHLFGEFLVEKKLVDAAEYKEKNDFYYQQYSNQQLDIHQYIRFCTKPLQGLDKPQLDSLHDEFYRSKIKPLVRQQGIDAIDRHKAQGDVTLILTATHEYVSRPIAERFNVDTILATDLERKDTRITGNILGTPCFAEGKVTRINQWLASNVDHDLAGSYFYSDSINDLPLLSAVTYPVAVTPDERLLAHAKKHQWKIISFA